jgi:ribosomal protein S18 acetylase RimI-like enzyme
VELSRFRPGDRAERAQIRASLGLDDDQIAVGTVGRLVAEKGFLELFAAAEFLPHNFVVFAIGPEDPDKPDALSADAMDKARSAGVRFLGMRTDIDELYRALDIFVLPSHREGFPRSAMEAAASGLPVVATDIRGCREVVESGKNGQLVPVGDPVRLAAAITEIGSDPELGRRMGLAGIERAHSLFDENAVVERVLMAYRKTALTKGLDDLARKLERGDRSIRMRTALPSDARMLARLHLTNIDSGFLSSLGPSFLEQVYRSLISWPDAVVLVADGGAGPIGFVAGVSSTSAFYKHFLIRRGVRAGIAALPQLVRPSQARRAWETLTYREQDENTGQSAELLALAVHPDWRGQGLGTELGQLLLEKLAHAEAIKVVVGADNATAIRAYERMGFHPFTTIEVHRGTRSSVMTWQRDSTS